MGQITHSVELPASPEKVFEVAGDPNTFEKWLTLHVKWKGDVPTEIAQGTQMTEVVSMLNMPNTITWTVDEYDVPRQLKISGTGMAGVKVEIDLSVEPKGDGSLFSLSTNFEGQMIVGALGKAIEKQGQGELEKSVANLTALLA